jgi:hypothetical protein
VPTHRRDAKRPMPSIRIINFRCVLEELGHDGVDDGPTQARILGLSDKALGDILAGGIICDAMARNIEWAAHKPYRWLDADHADEPLG